MNRVTALLALLLFPLNSWAVMPVEVEHSGDDSIGVSLVYFVKETIRKSSSMQISLDNKQVHMLVNITTLDQNPSQPGNSTVYSVDILWSNPEQPFPFYLTNVVGYCGSSRVQDCANEIVADVSEQSDDIIKLISTYSKKQ